jgi:hypothetical protein
MWTYQQSTGQLSLDGELVGTGYAGHDIGVDQPDLQSVPNIGPLPRGVYTIAPAIEDAHTGPLSMHLIPDVSNEMFGRGSFLIHGDNAQCNRTASEGCIIMQHDVRLKVSESVDRQLEVIA